MHASTCRRVVASGLVGFSLATACGTLDTQDLVHDLRILGMRADPPEQLLSSQGLRARDGGGRLGGGPTDGGPPRRLDGGSLGGLFDGGLAGLLDAGLDLCELIAEYDAGALLPPGFDAGCSSGAGGLTPFRVTALVADPAGSLRTLHFSWATCATVDANSRCETDSVGYQPLASGDFQPTSISSELTTTVSLPLPLLVEALGAGLTSVDVPVQLTVTAGSETDVGVKFLVVTPFNEFEPVVPNTNPVIDGLEAGGVQWSPTSPPIFTSVAAGGTGGGAGPFGRATNNGGVPVNPELDAGPEYFFRYSANGTPTEYQEHFQFQFYTTMGSFAPLTTGRAGSVIVPYTGPEAGLPPICSPDAGRFLLGCVVSPDAGVDAGADGGEVDAGPDAGPPFQSYWAASANQASQTVTFWVVVEDGRGGVSWVERTAEYAP